MKVTVHGHKVEVVPVKSKYGIGKFRYWTANVYEDGKLVLEGDQLENDPELAIHDALSEYEYETKGDAPC